MKKKLLLLFSLFIAFAINGQSIAITSIDTNPVEIDPVTGGTITVNYIYTSTNADDVIYVALELLDDWTYESTVVDANVDPAAMGTDLTGSFVLSISETTVLTADLTGDFNYKIKVEMYDAGWANWLAGDYPATEIVLQAPTAGLNDINANEIVLYPNPVSDKLMLKSNLLNANTIIISNILGKTVKSIDNAQYIESIDVSNLQNGLYILTVNNQKQFKFLKN